MGRSPCCAKVGLNRGAWTALEDKILTDYVQVHGQGKWKQLPKHAGLNRCGKSCRLRWLNYLRQDIKRGNISEDEEALIVRIHKLLGNRWSLIAGRIPGRTDNEIKNYWNTKLSKKASSQVATTIPNRPKQSTTNNAINRIIDPSSSRVFRTRATRCAKVFIQPPPPPKPATTNNIIHNYNHDAAFVEHSLFSSSSAIGGGIMPELFTTNLLGDDDLGLGDFCLSDFLNTDHHDEFMNIDMENEKDHVFSGAVMDVHENPDEMKQSSGTENDNDQNHQLFSLFIDSYDHNWDI
ncbi:unnamed protein product [Rhodiola kirilowii]